MTMRRSFLVGIGAAATGCVACLARAADVKPAARMRRIGLLLNFMETEPSADRLAKEFDERMRELGYVEGVNVQIERRFAGTVPERLRTFFAELVASQPEVIVISGSATAALRGNSTQIPIVAMGDDLVGWGLANSLARPSGNVTGVSIESPDLVLKRLQLLKEAAPQIQRVTVLQCPLQRAAFPGLRAAADGLGVTPLPVTVHSAEQAEAALAELKSSTADALLVLDCLWNHEQRSVTALPASYYSPGFVREGSLMSYSADWREVVRMLVYDVDEILKGAKPADIPIQQPTRFDLIINLRTAKALGLTIPRSLLLRADEVIQ
jgi:putative ABC transport system substrate-binding protein